MALRERITQVAQLREEIARVAAPMDDAQAQNEMIADAVTRATEISEQNAAAAEETAAATEQQLASLESVAASVRVALSSAATASRKRAGSSPFLRASMASEPGVSCTGSRLMSRTRSGPASGPSASTVRLRFSMMIGQAAWQSP